jgi:hypothetical protein
MLPAILPLIPPLVKFGTVMFSRVTVPIILALADAMSLFTIAIAPLSTYIANIIAAGLEWLVNNFERLASVIAPALGALVALGGHLTDGAKPATEFAGAAGEVVATMPAVVTTVDAASGAVTGLGGAATDAAGGVGDLGAGLGDAADEFAAFTEDAGVAKGVLDEFAAATAGFAPILNTGISAAIGAARDLASISLDVADSQAAAADAVADLAAGQRAAAGDSDEMRRALEQVTDTERAITDAQKDARQAQLDLTRARADAVEQLEDLRFAAEGGVLGEESARIRLIETQQEAAKILADPGSTELEKRKARLNLAEAELALKRAIDGNSDSQKDLNAAQRAGVDGSPGVVAALGNIEAANGKVVEAQKAHQDAIKETARLQKEAINALPGLARAATRAVMDIISPLEATLRRFEILSGAQEAQRTVLAGFIADSGGDFGKFNADVMRFVENLTASIAEAQGITRTEAAAIAQSIVKPPDLTEFNKAWAKILETREAAGEPLPIPVTVELDDARRDVTTFIRTGYEAKVGVTADTDPAWKSLYQILQTPLTKTIRTVVDDRAYRVWRDRLLRDGFGGNQIGFRPAFSAGGHVPGPNVGRDVVPAMLTPGEVVIRTSAVKMFGLDELLALNRGVVPPGWVVPRRFAEGGEVPDVAAQAGAFLASVAPQSGLGSPWAPSGGWAAAVPPSTEVAAYTAMLHEAGQAQRIVELAAAPSVSERARQVAHSLSVEFGARPAERTAGDERPVGEAVKAELTRFRQDLLALMAAASDNRPLVGSLTVQGKGDGRRDAATIVRELAAERWRRGL